MCVTQSLLDWFASKRCINDEAGELGSAAKSAKTPVVAACPGWPQIGRPRLLPTNHPMMSVQAFDVDKRATPPPALPDVPRKWNWTEEEKRIILENVQRHGTQWDLVAAQLPGRTADAVRNHCHRLQRSNLYSNGSSEDRKTSTGHGRTVWTAEEDRIICEGMEAFGCKWRRIAAKLPGRSDSSVRNRWSRICDCPTAPATTKTSTPVSEVGPGSATTSGSHAAPATQPIPPQPACSVPTAYDARAAAAAAAFYPHLLCMSARDFGSWQLQQLQQMQLPPPVSKRSQPLPPQRPRPLKVPPPQAPQQPVPDDELQPESPQENPNQEKEAEGLPRPLSEPPLPSALPTPRTSSLGEQQTRSPSPVGPGAHPVETVRPAPRLAVPVGRQAQAPPRGRRPQYRLAYTDDPRDDLPAKKRHAKQLVAPPRKAAKKAAPTAAAVMLPVGLLADADADAAGVLPVHEFDGLSSSDSARCLFLSEMTSASRPPPAAVPDGDELPEGDVVGPGGDVAPLMRLFVDSLEQGLRPGPGAGPADSSRASLATEKLRSLPVVV